MAQQPYWAGSKPIDETTLAVPGAAPANIPSGSPLDPLRTPPLSRAPVAAAAPGRTQSVPTGGVYLTRPPPPKPPPEAVLTTEEKIAEGIPPDKLHLPYRRDAAGNIGLPPGLLPDKDDKDKPQKDLIKARQLLRASVMAAKRSKYRSVEGLMPGLTGAGSSIAAYTPAGQSLAGDLAIIGSNEAFDALSKMRAESPTGGALGNVTERELDLLKSTNYSLKPGQQDVDFARNMDEVVKNNTDLFVRLGGDPAELENVWGDEAAATTAEQEQAAGAGPNAPPGGPDAPPSLSMSVSPEGKIVLKDLTGPQTIGGDTGLIGLEGGTHTEVDPRFAGANKAISGMVKRHRTAEEIADYMKGKGFAPDQIDYVKSQLVEIRQWEEDHNAKWNGAVSIENVDVPNTGLQNFQQSDVGAGLTGYVDAASMFSIDNVAGMLSKDPEEVRTALDASRTAHPTSTLAGNIAGGVTTALGGEAAAGAAGFGRVAAPVTADLALGAGSGFFGTDVNPETGAPATVGERLWGAAKGTAAAGVGTAVGRGVTGGLKALGSPAGNVPARVLNEEGIPTTLGSQYGGKWKQFEDWFRGQPGGGIAKQRQIEAIGRVNERTFDRALKPLGVRNPKGLVGNEAVEFAQDQVSKQYGKALDGKVAALDPDWAIDSAKSFQDMADLPTVGPEVLKRVEGVITPHVQGGQLTGEGMQRINEQLRAIKASYRGTPMAYEIGQAIDEMSESVFGVFRRSADPDVVKEYNKAQVAYKRLAIASDAVLKAEQAGGIFMPSQLRAADKAASERSGGKISAAANKGKGERQFGRLSAAAQERLPSKLPDSGTARFVLPALLLGTSGATTIGGEAVESEGLSNVGKVASLAAILSLAYTKGGQRLLTKPGRGITNPKAARAARVVGEKGQTPLGHVGAAEAVALREKKKKAASR